MTLQQVLTQAAESLGGATPHLGEVEELRETNLWGGAADPSGPRVAPSRAAAAPQPAASADAVASFRSQLAAISSTNAAYFKICVGLLLVLFAGACWLVARTVSQPNQAAAVFAATGVSFMGIFAKMVRLWKDKVNSDLIISLAGSLKPADLRTIVMILVRAQK